MKNSLTHLAEGQKVQNSNAICNTCHHCVIIISK